MLLRRPRGGQRGGLQVASTEGRAGLQAGWGDLEDCTMATATE